MTKKRPRRNSFFSQDQDFHIQNPKMIQTEEDESTQTQNQEHQDFQNHQQKPLEEDEEEEEEQHEQEGIALYPTPINPLAHDSIIPSLIPESPLHTASNVARKATKRKKPLTRKKRVALEKKLQIIKENLKPIPFVPNKTLDFSKHEKLFKLLGLWDFVHIEFDRDIRMDLLVQLIANFNAALRCSSVNDLRVMVNRADLARALKLPVKKDKINVSEASEFDSEVLTGEAILFIDDFVSNWILLHEDTWMMPEEILTSMRLIKEGQPQKVDWARLIWYMVEKELMKAPQLEDCFYASHLQYLMKSQREDLFKEEPRAEVSIKDEEDAVEVDGRTSSLKEFHGQDLEKQRIELCLWQEKIESEQVRDEDPMNFQVSKEEEEHGMWLLDGKNNVGEHCFQRCNGNEVGGSECQIERKEAEEDRYGLSSKYTNLESLSSTDLIQGMGTTSLPYSSQPLNHSSDNLMNPAGPSVFGNACKREISLEDDIHHHSLNDQHKRMRNDGQWDHKQLSFDMCMEQVQSWMDKAKIMYVAKEQAAIDAQLHHEYLVNCLEQQKSYIEVLNKTKFEETQKRELEIYRLERELYVMSNLLDGYRKALKGTRRAFSEYREHCLHLEEPLYKDIGGTGGNVLSTTELEKQHLQQEEEDRIKRCMIEEMIEDFQLGWFDKFEEYSNKVHLLGKRVCESENEVKCLKEMFTKHKISET